jgi:molecular chaperone GrpE
MTTASSPDGAAPDAPTAPGPGDDAPAAGAGDGLPGDPEPAVPRGDSDGDVEAAVAAAEVSIDIEIMAIVRERDEYLDALRRLQADFENYKKRVDKQRTEHVERAAGELVTRLLPVCDTADLAIAHGGGEEVKQVWTALMEALERVGLERIDPVGVPFDPTVHDAVAHEPGDVGGGDPEVVEVFRTGYLWKGRVLRPAMVKVKG